MTVFVHETAIVDEGAVLEDGVRVWHFVHVSRGAHIGQGVVLGQNVFIAPGVRIGRGTKIQNNVSVYAGVTIEEDVFLGPSCVFTNVINPRAFIERKDEFRETRIGRGASVGANATIVCGHDVGAYAMVGAGAVVTRDVPEHTLVVGVPARAVGFVCTCGDRLPEGAEVACARCGARFHVTSDRCVAVRG